MWVIPHLLWLYSFRAYSLHLYVNFDTEVMVTYRTVFCFPYRPSFFFFSIDKFELRPTPDYTNIIWTSTKSKMGSPAEICSKLLLNFLLHSYKFFNHRTQGIKGNTSQLLPNFTACFYSRFFIPQLFSVLL